MADRPAVLRIDEVHGGKQQLDRHVGLPYAAVGVAQEDVATGADQHQAVTEALQVGEQPLPRIGGDGGRSLEPVGDGSAEGGRGEQAGAQAEHQAEAGANGGLHGVSR
ncbi:hypothetical protein D3C85_1406930 [compost metagenome]